MRTFHTGGTAGVDITHGLPRVEELFELRPPKGKAVLSGVAGRVENIEDRGTLKVLIITSDNEKSGRRGNFGLFIER